MLPLPKAKIFNKNLDLTERVQLGILYIFRLTIIIVLAAGIFTQKWDIAFFSFFLLLLTSITSIIEFHFAITFPIEIEFLTALLVYVSLFLGDLQGYYNTYWWWDALLHTGAGVFFGFLGFIVIYTLYKKDKLTARPFWIAFFAFCFAMAVGAVWEIFEYGMDQYFPFNMQENGLVDTMWDLIVNMIGALFISWIGYFYIKGGSIPFVSRLIQKIKKKNPKLFKQLR